MKNKIDSIKEDLNKNIIKWYPFHKNAEILTIGSTLEDIDINKKFDYIILLGALENSDHLFNGDNPEQNLMSYVKKHLKSNGKLLIITDNDLGIENLCNDIEENKKRQLLNRQNIEKLLFDNQFNYQKFYYVLPNYKYANVICTDEFLPNQETMERNIVLSDEDTISLKDQRNIFMKLIDQDKHLFKIFANSYFVECSTQKFDDNQIKFVSFSNMRKREFSIQTIIQGNHVFKTAGNEDAINHIEEIKKNIDILKKYKFNILDSYNRVKIISKFQKNQNSFDIYLRDLILNNEKEKAIYLIRKFFDEIKFKLSKNIVEENIFDSYKISYEKEQIKKLTFVKDGFWDLIFQNAFYINGKFYFYDQEWKKCGIPVEYIFYRSIKYDRNLNKMLDMDCLLESYGITKEILRLFQVLDDKIQVEIRSNKILKWHVNSILTARENLQQKTVELNNYQNLLNEKDIKINNLEENIILKEKNIADLNNDIKEKTKNIFNLEKSNEQLKNNINILEENNKILDNNNKVLESYINNIINSTSWKITEPFRSLKRYIKELKNTHKN